MTNVDWLMQQVGVDCYPNLHAWSVAHREDYWCLVVERLGIVLQQPYGELLDLSGGIESPRWLVGSRLNIVESCFLADPEALAIVHQAEGGAIERMSYGELRELTDRIAANLRWRGFSPGQAIAVIMPMTPMAVALYLAIAKVGCVIVGIPESFRSKEIATRLKLADAVAVFTQETVRRAGKTIHLHEAVRAAGGPEPILVDATGWLDALPLPDAEPAVAREAGDHLNILFSSGTTGTPKAIPWNHTTPIKCAADAHFHHDTRPGDVLLWPTSLGWMMGPWLIFASLMNRAAMGLFDGAPTGRQFARFVQDSGATMLGVVPSLVRNWRRSGCTDGMDWSGLRLFSSTGECSNADDMRWLMDQAGGRPVVEYCGGTEIGGAYITSTLARECRPGQFNTPALGVDLEILDDTGQPADEGEVYLSPPFIGLSTELVNGDHHAVYYEGAPAGLRRHGDQLQRLADGYYRAHGRVDDTMNLNGIKVSAIEIEQAVASLPQVAECAAVSVSVRDGGPGRLVIYAVPAINNVDAAALLLAARRIVREDLSPLFKVDELLLVNALPRTASNKIIRRALRD